jgi:hypothetical protein
LLIYQKERAIELISLHDRSAQIELDSKIKTEGLHEKREKWSIIVILGNALMQIKEELDVSKRSTSLLEKTCSRRIYL